MFVFTASNAKKSLITFQKIINTFPSEENLGRGKFLNRKIVQTLQNFRMWKQIGKQRNYGMSSDDVIIKTT